MIGSIKRGDALKCLNCGEKIVVDGVTIQINFTGEFIKCPHCDRSYDVQKYHMYGEFYNESVKKQLDQVKQQWKETCVKYRPVILPSQKLREKRDGDNHFVSGCSDHTHEETCEDLKKEIKELRDQIHELHEENMDLRRELRWHCWRK